ncbi:hypothetical protein [Lysinibacillus fusiformis]|uniref:hypothetical protein n=1 Tax=Lysinibacillus fusiformis TaxID=28031 RepID=UPI0023AA0479|nr:hypothetical protein [Lysinibacillus fusiformis]WEA41822.1 hypothetical protein PWJ66_23635 [Lysinibacillus fusiformis]
MYERFSSDERKQILSLLTVEQRDFLENEVKRGRKTIFENFMRDEKITAIKSVDTILQEDERDVVDWLIADYVDFGLGNRGGRCACKLPLRYMFTVEHQKTGKRIQYGKNHLSTFLNIEVKDIDGYINELDNIDHELDELLRKITENQYYHEYYERIPDKLSVPGSIKKHIEVNIPLLDTQINRLIKYFDKQMEEWKIEQARMQHEVELEKRQEENKRIEKLIEEKRKIEVMLESANRGQAEAELKRQQLKEVREKRLEQERIEKNAKSVEATKAQLGNGATFEDIAYTLVLNGQNSAVDISFIMTNDFGCDKRMSVSTMHRPYIYYDVLLALKKQVDNGSLIMDESSNVVDCIFYVNPYSEEETSNVIVKEELQQQQTFSLF